MKRIIEFQVRDEIYVFEENGANIFEISKSNRQLDVKLFYKALFANWKKGLEIELIKPSQLDKDDERIYNAINKLFNEICSRLQTELPAKTEDQEEIQAYTMGDH